MERLTNVVNGIPAYIAQGQEPCAAWYMADEDVYRVLKRLAAYEDTGLEPQEVETMRESKADAQFMLTELCKHVDYDRLEELAQADKEGRVVVLPVKVGDTVFSLTGGYVTELKVESIHCWSSGKWKVNARTEKTSPYWKGFEIDLDGFSKEVFLTREEAEKALQESEADRG